MYLMKILFNIVDNWLQVGFYLLKKMMRCEDNLR